MPPRPSSRNTWYPGTDARAGPAAHPAGGGAGASMVSNAPPGGPGRSMVVTGSRTSSAVAPSRYTGVTPPEDAARAGAGAGGSIDTFRHPTRPYATGAVQFWASFFRALEQVRAAPLQQTTPPPDPLQT